MRRIARYTFYLSCCLLSTIAMAQTKIVTGKVVDQDGQIIPRASLSIKGTQKGTIANNLGVFSIEVATGDVLVVSATGYSNYQVTIASGTDLSAVTLIKSNKVLDEVVVTALGQSRSKAKVGYSVATFNSETITKNAPVGRS